MIDKEKKDREVVPSKEESTPKTEKIENENEKGDEKKAGGKATKKGTKGTKKQQSLSKQIVIETDLAGGVAVQDYSHLYKSFYDIFVGQILEPKTFDLAFVVRDTRNTYA